MRPCGGFPSASRSGARKTELNAEAQREYERTLEAGPTLAR